MTKTPPHRDFKERSNVPSLALRALPLVDACQYLSTSIATSELLDHWTRFLIMTSIGSNSTTEYNALRYRTALVSGPRRF